MINLMVIYNNNLFEKIFKNAIVVNNGILYYLTLVILALSGIYVTVKASQKINRQKALEYIGRNSITFFGLHVLIF
jgi:surface polysaccharide O-acyltransferase-like enzyme